LHGFECKATEDFVRATIVSSGINDDFVVFNVLVSSVHHLEWDPSVNGFNGAIFEFDNMNFSAFFVVINHAFNERVPHELLSHVE
jgi:hypothetical protein